MLVFSSVQYNVHVIFLLYLNVYCRDLVSGFSINTGSMLNNFSLQIKLAKWIRNTNQIN